VEPLPRRRHVRPEPEVKDGDISRFDSVAQTYTVALPTYRDNKMFRDVVMGSVSYYQGSHDLKLGYQYQEGRGKIGRLVPLACAPSTATACPTRSTPTTRRWHFNRGIAIGRSTSGQMDAAAPVVLNLGIRFETNYGWQPALSVETIFVQARCFGDHRRARFQRRSRRGSPPSTT
jgi:hypothetical protein